MIIFIILVIVYVLSLLTIAVWALVQLVAPTLREKHNDSQERSPILNEVKKMVGIKRRGYIFNPPSEAEESRQAIIEERRKQGLDTPINLLREENDEEN